MEKGKKKYSTREFKEKAGKLVLEQGYRISEAANSLGVSERGKGNQFLNRYVCNLLLFIPSHHQVPQPRTKTRLRRGLILS
jgi:transposase-like protein